ncbi:hypothetical protein [Spirosoma jeollabukense]
MFHHKSKSQKTIRDGIRYGLTSPVYPDEKPDRESYFSAQPFYAKTILPTAKPPISILAIGIIEIAPIIATETTVSLNTIFKPDESQLERLTGEPVDSYPAELDGLNPPGAVPQIKELTFFEWQRKYPPFNQLGLATLQTTKQSWSRPITTTNTNTTSITFQVKLCLSL